MDIIYNFGLQIILAVQSLGTWLEPVMEFFSYLGIEEFYLILLPAVFWCWDAALGLRLGVGLVVSALCNSLLKLALHMPRPYWVDARVQAFSSETSFGAPSGHAQNAVVVWGTIARFIKKPWGWTLAVFLIFFIGLSRIYLGVHFPHDVFIGWLIGALLLWAFVALEKRWLPITLEWSITKQIGTAFILSLFVLGLYLLVYWPISEWEVPQTWIIQAQQSAPQAETLHPIELSGAVSNAGTLFGMLCGAALLKSKGWYQPGKSAWKRGLCFVIGVCGVILLYGGLSAILPRGESLVPQLFRYLRYAIVGIWVALLAPTLFIRLRLAEKQA